MNNYENKVAVITAGTPNQEKEWANYNRRVKSHGVKTCVQLGAGAGQNSVVPPFVKALSASEMPLYFKPKKHTIAMSKKQIHDLVAAFGKAAASAKRAGFDAVEIHAHTGYMLDQFISECWNHRTDEYGGSVENRARIVCEIIEEIRRNVGEDFPIILRVSMNHKMPNQRTPEESQELIKVIDKTSVTAYDVDLGCYGSGAWGRHSRLLRRRCVPPGGTYHPGRTAAIIRQEMDLRLAGYKQPLAQSNATMEYTKLSKSPI